MKKILTIILDGFGMREDIYGNAVKMAGMNNFIELWNNYPHALLKANGEHVNLPEDQCSSSEIGHLIIGAGRQVENKLNSLNKALKNNSLRYNNKFMQMTEYLKRNIDKSLHLSILLSDGGVSSHINHLVYFLKNLYKSNVTNKIYLHLITDGNDSGKFTSYDFINSIKPYLEDNVLIASACGRYYAMDNTNNYKRTKMYYDLLLDGRGVNAKNMGLVIKKCYEKKMSDEFLPPIKTNKFKKVEAKDVLCLLNFSKYNQNQLLDALCNENFVEFNNYRNNFYVYSLYEINGDVNKNYFFQSKKYDNTLLEYLAKLGLKEALVYESIKAGSVNYYLTGEKYVNSENIDRFRVETPVVDSFDLKPELNSLNVARTAIKCMEEDYDFVLCNFANPDIIGHTGNYQATINGLQAIDVCLGKILEVAENNFYKVVIIGSHSNADTIIDRDNNIVPNNTLSPVPFMIIDKKIKLSNGNLSSFAPTLLKYMDIAIPKEMKETEILIEKVRR